MLRDEEDLQLLAELAGVLDATVSDAGLCVEAFGGLPVLTAPLFGGEVSGDARLYKLADALYGDKNPADRMFDGQTHRIEKDADNGYRLIVPLPFADKTDMDLYRSRDELTLRVGPYRRNIVLPYALWDLEIADAKFLDESLNIRFRQPAASGQQPAVSSPQG